MATTPNYGWVTPAPTDFVTDLPADFETFADAVDADLAGLLGGTTGQVLTKDSNTDHDFSWQTTTSGGYTQIATGTFSNNASVSITSIPSTYRNLELVLQNVNLSGTANVLMTVNAGGTDYQTIAYTRRANTNEFIGISDSTTVRLGLNVWSGGDDQWVIEFLNYSAAAYPHGRANFSYTNSSSEEVVGGLSWGQLQNATAVSSIELSTSANTFLTGSYTLYGVK